MRAVLDKEYLGALYPSDPRGQRRKQENQNDGVTEWGGVSLLQPTNGSYGERRKLPGGILGVNAF